MPVERVGEDAAEQHADGAAAGHHEAEDAHRLRALGRLGEQGHDQRQRDRRDDGAAEALHGARGDRASPATSARPQASEATVKSEMPTRNSRRWPKRSPSRPPSSRKPPKVSRYALTTQASDVCGEAEVVADRGQRDVHDRRVEDDHQVAEAEDEEREPAGAVVQVMTAFLSVRRSSAVSTVDASRRKLIGDGTDEFLRGTVCSDGSPSAAYVVFPLDGRISTTDLPVLCERMSALLERTGAHVAICRREPRRSRCRDGGRGRAASARAARGSAASSFAALR